MTTPKSIFKKQRVRIVEQESDDDDSSDQKDSDREQEKEIIQDGYKISFSEGEKLKSLEILLAKRLDIMKVHEIDLSSNDIYSVQKLNQFEKLIKVNASYNKIQKFIPNLPNLIYLDLSFNELQEV